jgi:hypothetical protein
MARKLVTSTGKDHDGDITALCGPDPSWWRVSKQHAIRDIKQGSHSYFVRIGQRDVDIHVVNDAGGGMDLRTDPDTTTRNNLRDLPDC